VLNIDSLLFVCYSLASFAFNRPILFDNMELFQPVKREEQIQDSAIKTDEVRSAFVSFFADLPHKHILWLGRLLGRFMYFADVPHRRIVRRNLKFVYPEWTQKRIKETSLRIFQNIGITFIEICQIACLPKDNILFKTKVKGKKILLDAIKNNKGAILISAHLGNWEIVAPFLSANIGKRASMVGRKLRVKPINRLISELRTRFGATVIDKEDGMPKMMRAIREGKMLGIMLDQGTQSSMGVKVNFFDRAVTATHAPALLALRCRCPVVPIFGVREIDGSLTIIVESPLNLTRTKDLKVDLQVNTQLMVNAIEKAVRAYPEQWFWVHKRWKKYYPHLYPEYMARKKRRRARKSRKISSVKGV
jgi:Kdo2-lipid IVA lauroyltransferase/acyltransferase